MRDASEKRLYIIAGPNGAGKTTFALEYLPQVAGCARFINADLIAAGLSPLASERALIAASRLFLREIEECIKSHEDFAFENHFGRQNLPASDQASTTRRLAGDFDLPGPAQC